MALGSFDNPITGGGGSLLINQIKSPDFVAGVSGWDIRKDGSAEFNNLTIRGTFQGTDFVINPSGMFFYSPTEASGNLALSICPAAATGPFGESVPAGVTVGKLSDSAQVELVPSPGGQAAQVKFPVNAIAVSNIPNISAGIVAGTPNFSDLVISGPALATAGEKDWTQIILYSNDPGLAQDAHAEFRYIDTNGNVTVAGTFDGAQWQMLLNIVMGTGAFISNDTAHAFGAFNAGFSHGSPAPQFKMYPDNTVALSGQVSATSGTTSGVVVTLPTSTYWPVTAKTFNIPFAGGTPAATGCARLGIGTNGNLNLAGGPTGAAWTFNLDGIRFPLDF